MDWRKMGIYYLIQGQAFFSCLGGQGDFSSYTSSSSPHHSTTLRKYFCIIVYGCSFNACSKYPALQYYGSFVSMFYVALLLLFYTKSDSVSYCKRVLCHIAKNIIITKIQYNIMILFQRSLHLLNTWTKLPCLSFTEPGLSKKHWTFLQHVNI